MQIDKDRLPKHIAIIMDGNGRWAKDRGLAINKGHREGLEAAKRVVKRASDLGILHLSFYVFSTENWKRVEEEVSFLMKLISIHLKKEYEFYNKNNVKLFHIGDLARLPKNIQKDIIDAKNFTMNNDGVKVALAINYGGQNEIIRAIKKIYEDDSRAEIIKNLDHKNFSKYLDTKDFPPVDLLIRTSGELRLSNFMLYQSAYAELFFDKKYWPSWNGDDLDQAILEFQNRNRRFGKRI